MTMAVDWILHVELTCLQQRLYLNERIKLAENKWREPGSYTGTTTSRDV